VENRDSAKRALGDNFGRRAPARRILLEQEMKWLVAMTAICIAAASIPASGESARQLTWSDLVPQLEKFDDPFAALSVEQKLDLSVVAAARQMQARGQNVAPKQKETIDAAIARLKTDKVDIDGLLARRAEITEKRRQAAEAVNEQLNGQQVRMPGYVLPLETDGKKVTEFLLVPYVGACIHAPTPPPNQIVHVKHGSGYEAGGMFAPVWVQGTMRTVRGERKLSLVDGSANIPTGYAMEAAAVEPYGK